MSSPPARERRPPRETASSSTATKSAPIVPPAHSDITLVIADRTLELGAAGSLMLYPIGAGKRLAELEPDDVHDPAIRQVLLVIAGLVRAGVEPAAPLVVDRLIRGGDVRTTSDANWAVLVSDCVAHAALPASFTHWRSALVRLRMRREVARFGAQLSALAPFGSDAEVQAAVDGALATIGMQLGRLAVTRQPRPVAPGQRAGVTP